MSLIERVGSAYLWQTAASPAVVALRARAFGLLGLWPGNRVLDIGCGPGTAVAGLGSLVGPLGQVVGVDSDPEMVRLADLAARQAGMSGWVRHETTSATSLPFPAATFDACYCERVLQHLAPVDADTAIAEAMRVSRPGASLVFVDTDWGSFSVDSDAPHIERLLQAAHLGRFRNPYSGRTLARRLREAGLAFVFAEPLAMPLSGAAVANLLAGAERDATLDQAQRRQWAADAAIARAGEAVAGHVTMVLAAARRP